jgi:hypothetical protein
MTCVHWMNGHPMLAGTVNNYIMVPNLVYMCVLVSCNQIPSNAIFLVWFGLYKLMDRRRRGEVFSRVWKHLRSVMPMDRYWGSRYKAQCNFFKCAHTSRNNEQQNVSSNGKSQHWFLFMLTFIWALIMCIEGLLVGSIMKICIVTWTKICTWLAIFILLLALTHSFISKILIQ